jgi:hypothetical protein
MDCCWWRGWRCCGRRWGAESEGRSACGIAGFGLRFIQLQTSHRRVKPRFGAARGTATPALLSRTAQIRPQLFQHIPHARRYTDYLSMYKTASAHNNSTPISTYRGARDCFIPQSTDYSAQVAGYITLDLMNTTVFWTVLSGVVTYVLGQLAVKLVIDPVQEMKRTIGQIAHALIEHANVIGNPGVPSREVMDASSKHLRSLSSQLQSHVYLVPGYQTTARVFGLPRQANVLEATGLLIGLSNSLHRATDRVYEHNAKRVEKIHDLLGIYMAPGDRYPREAP